MPKEMHKLTEHEHEVYRESFIREQLARAGGYYALQDAVQILRDFTLLTQQLLTTYDVDPEDDYLIDVHTGVIVIDYG